MIMDRARWVAYSPRPRREDQPRHLERLFGQRLCTIAGLPPIASRRLFARGWAAHRRANAPTGTKRNSEQWSVYRKAKYRPDHKTQYILEVQREADFKKFLRHPSRCSFTTSFTGKGAVSQKPLYDIDRGVTGRIIANDEFHR
jgi:hypothetical protein